MVERAHSINEIALSPQRLAIQQKKGRSHVSEPPTNGLDCNSYWVIASIGERQYQHLYLLHLHKDSVCQTSLKDLHCSVLHLFVAFR